MKLLQWNILSTAKHGCACRNRQQALSGSLWTDDSGNPFAQYNNLESVKELVNEKTCAIIFETVQGEGGVYPAKKEFIEGVRKLCDSMAF